VDPATQTDAGTRAPLARFDPVETAARPGQTLIEASAGTGKTFALVALALRLVLEGTPVGRLLIVTFTVDATEELTTRLREGLRAARAVFEGRPCPENKLEDLLARFEERFAENDEARRRSAARLRQALAASGDLSVFTIHGFCKHALEEQAFESGTPFRIDFVEEADDLLRRAAADCWRERVSPEPLLAELAVAQEWDVEALLEHVKKARRYPDTEIVPDYDLDEALAELEGKLADLDDAWDPAALRADFADFKWNKGAPVTAETLGERLQQVADAAAEKRLGVGLSAIRAFSSDALGEHANKRGKKRKQRIREMEGRAGPQACADVAAAAEKVETAFARWFARGVPRRFRALKRRRRVMTFDDLLSELLRALNDPARGERLAAALRASYDVALVDEFQDTDPRQYAIFRRIFSEELAGGEVAGEESPGNAPPERPVFLIGDAKQAIYRFRGADLHTYLGAKRVADRRLTLPKNWRSDTRLVKAVNAIFEQAPAPFLHENIPFVPAEAEGTPDDAPLTGDGLAPFVWWHHPPGQYESGAPRTVSKGDATERVVSATAGEIGRLLGSGEMTIGGRPLRASDLAVLVRANWQAEKVRAALVRCGVPAVVSARRSILDTREIAEIERFLRAVLEPRPEHLRAALATELWGKSACQISALSDDPARWATLERRFREWQRDWRERGVAYVLTRFIEEEDVRERLLALRDGERRLTNVRHGVELLREVEERRQQAPAGLMRWLARRGEERLLESEETELRLESDEHAVQVLTLHKSKGLEFNVVFCPFLWDARASERKDPPLVRTAEGAVYDLGSAKEERHRTLARAEERAESVRLAYVGMTRAVHRCYAVWGDINAAPKSALGYLLHAGVDEGHGAGRAVAEADTPAARAEAARRAAEAAQGRSRGPDRLETLFGEHPHIDIEPLRAVEERARPPAPAPPEKEEEAEPQARAVDFADRLVPWTYASYSRWAGEAHEPRAPAGPPAAEADGDDDPAEPEGLHAFAAGVRAGRCLHALLERADLTAAPNADKNRRATRRVLRRHRLDAPAHHRRPIAPQEVVADLLDRLRRAELPGAGFTLVDVEGTPRASEWSFALPVEEATPRALRPAFAEHGSALAQRYAPRLGALDAGAVDGFLRGTADLALEKGGAYYLVDWKSDRLGGSAAAYDDAALREAMCRRHYVLQHHLYAAALQRHLASRLGERYDPEQHFGGVWYVFLRGLQPGTERGIVFDRPSGALLAALNRRLGGEPTAGGGR
jgi:exodeoxyribonuclease V beta subunit